MTANFYDCMRRGLDGMDLEFSDDIIEKLYIYYEMLTEKNKVMNLTAVTGEEDTVNKHFIDSLSIVKAADLNKRGIKLIDVGTGAGFPGLVLKIAFPWLDVTLADSLNKRLLFISEVIKRLDLRNVCTLHSRAEDAGRSRSYREQYDVVCSRAVASMPVLLEYCLPFVKYGGIFAAYKSEGCSEELESSARALALLGGSIEKKEHIVLPGTDIKRCIVIVRKTASTPQTYPRKAGKPSVSPLL